MSKPSKNLRNKTARETHEYRHVDLRSMSLPIPAVGVFDEPRRCYRLNNQWAKTVLGFLSHLAENYVWDETTGDTQAALEAVIEFMIGEECGMNCNDVDDCLDTLPDWVAITNLTYQNAVNTPETTPEELEAQYDGTPQSIAPTVPDEPPNTLEANRLCYVVYRFISYFAATKAAEISLSNGFQTAMNSILEAAKRIVGSNNLGLLGSVLGDLTYGCAATVDEALAALQDDAAIQQLSCYIYNLLRCETLTQATFDAALADATTLNFTNPNADIVACILNNDNSDDLWRMFLFGYKVSQSYEDDGIELECPCTGQHWDYDVSFAQGLGNWVIHEGINDNGRLRGIDVGTHLSLVIRLTVPATVEMETCRLVYERVNTPITGFFDGWAMLVRPTPDVGAGTTTFASGTDTSGGLKDRCINDSTSVTTTRQIEIQIGSDDNPGQVAYLDRVRISGTGNIPPFMLAIDEPHTCVSC